MANPQFNETAGPLSTPIFAYKALLHLKNPLYNPFCQLIQQKSSGRRDKQTERTTMGYRRFAQLAASDDEDDAPPPLPPAPPPHSSNTDDEQPNRRKRKKMKLSEVEEQKEAEGRGKKKSRGEEHSISGGEEDNKEEVVQEDAKPIGVVIRVSGKGRGRRSHYSGFEYDGISYDLEDPVLLVPEETNQKPYVAIIKDISRTKNGGLMVTGQWFYRPEEAEKRGGGNWQSRDTRELFYSFHRDEVPAESVMHRCVVHFIPLNKQIPRRKQHPGFIVQKVYDTEQRRLFKLTDKDYEDSKQNELDVLIHKTSSRLGDLPDVEPEDSAADQEDQLKNKRLLRKKNMSPLDVSREDEATTRSGQSMRAETPGSVTSNTSEYYTILANFKVLTGETQRDKWLEKLLQGIQFICTPVENGQSDDKEKRGSHSIDHASYSNCTKTANGSQEKKLKGSTSFIWPDAAVPAVAALEKASHEALSSDFLKYNQKMRQLMFNLKNNKMLAGRLLNGELEPSKILNMSPNELKEGLTAEEIASKEPEESERMQMTDARCKRCKEKKVGLLDIIQAGHGDRYQLECIACGNTWYASRDEVSTLTIDGPSSAKSVGTAPWATAKFEDVEKKLVSPRESEKSAADVFKKTTEDNMPVLDSQKSFNKPKIEDSSAMSQVGVQKSAGDVSRKATEDLETQKSFKQPKTLDSSAIAKNAN
ncbi:protein REPRESSOR OF VERNALIZATION 1 [Cornus florida]|uniref:protein REPRESSOR OF VERNALIZATION 1 n=1 Tax=Cornus florida TaxID=4283 RepID=UPI0028A21E4A|nr:protein REPRESSOR OF VERNALIZATION 1 [Cornus florida]